MEALIQIQSRLNAPKTLRNNFGGYNYRSAESILEAVKPLLKEFNCQLTLSDEIIMVGSRIYIKATATIFDGKETVVVSGFAREDESQKGKDGAQVTGATSSYARKYALNGLFCIDDNKDPDTDEYARQQQTTSKKTAKPTDEDIITDALRRIESSTDTNSLEKLWRHYQERYPALCASGGKIRNATNSRLQALKNEAKTK